MTTPTSVDLPAHPGRTGPAQLPAACQGPAELAPGHLPPSPNGEPASQPLTPAEFFSEPQAPGELSSGTKPLAQRRAGSLAERLGKRPVPDRRVLVLAGICVLVIAAAVAVVALRGYHRAQGTSASGQNSAAGPLIAAAAAPPSTGPPPADFRWYTVPAGTTAGFTIAVPNGWTVPNWGATTRTATYFNAPGRSRYLEVDLTPHTYTSMLREARWLAARTQRQGKFPGYRELGVRAVNVRGMNAAAWEFTWQDPGLGRVHVLDLMYIVPTPEGSQSYALYLSAPERAWSRSLGVFGEEMRTFRPEF
jgi:hypothetical protein